MGSARPNPEGRINSSSINLFKYGSFVLVGLISGQQEQVWVQVLGDGESFIIEVVYLTGCVWTLG